MHTIFVYEVHIYNWSDAVLFRGSIHSIPLDGIVCCQLNHLILEPVMKVCVEGPAEFQGNVLATINQRRGIIISTSEDNIFARVEADVPLSEMFGYSTILRSQTQGKSEYTMEFLKHGLVPESIADQLKKEYLEKKNGK